MSEPLVTISLHEWLNLKAECKRWLDTIAAMRAQIEELAAGRSHYAAECDRLVTEVGRLTKEVQGYEAFKRSVDEALNSGDGTYRP